MNDALALQRICKRYGRRLAVDEATFSIFGGDILGLVGPNGAGKTTLLRIAAGLIVPTSGVVAPAFPTVPGSVGYFGGERTVPPQVAVRRWRSLWNLDPCDQQPRDHPPSSDRPRGGWHSTEHTGSLGTLSRGQRQRLGLEATLASNTMRLLLLDEPWEGLDPDASRWLSRELILKREAGVAVVVSSHRIHDLAQVSDRCRFMVGGRVVPDALVSDEGSLAESRAGRIFAALDQARRCR